MAFKGPVIRTIVFSHHIYQHPLTRTLEIGHIRMFHESHSDSDYFLLHLNLCWFPYWFDKWGPGWAYLSLMFYLLCLMKTAAPQISLLAALLDKKKLSPVTDLSIKTPKGVMCEHILINFVCFTTGASIWREGSVKLQPTPIYHTALHKMDRCIYLYISCHDKKFFFFFPCTGPHSPWKMALCLINVRAVKGFLKSKCQCQAVQTGFLIVSRWFT